VFNHDVVDFFPTEPDAPGVLSEREFSGPNGTGKIQFYKSLNGRVEQYGVVIDSRSEQFITATADLLQNFTFSGLTVGFSYDVQLRAYILAGSTKIPSDTTSGNFKVQAEGKLLNFMLFTFSSLCFAIWYHFFILNLEIQQSGRYAVMQQLAYLEVSWVLEILTIFLRNNTHLPACKLGSRHLWV
jgi:hypothetical protein